MECSRTTFERDKEVETRLSLHYHKLILFKEVSKHNLCFLGWLLCLPMIPYWVVLMSFSCPVHCRESQRNHCVDLIPSDNFFYVSLSLLHNFSFSSLSSLFLTINVCSLFKIYFLKILHLQIVSEEWHQHHKISNFWHFGIIAMSCDEGSRSVHRKMLEFSCGRKLKWFMGANVSCVCAHACV